jgi:hypothetical protein
MIQDACRAVSQKFVLLIIHPKMACYRHPRLISPRLKPGLYSAIWIEDIRDILIARGFS